jgi:hypothetical protein
VTIALRIAGGILGVAGILVVLGWVQTPGQDCMYTTDVVLQLRMCELGSIAAGYKGSSASWLVLLAGVAALIAGVFLVRHSRRGHP